ncbi:hypothetical protein BCR39DRAFT_589107 [Naematelia encephala]|uniref:Uncharacterized protein n=1 Tax=Naematelia encephala TaxID=71784 RepID=A0A1Y2B0P8_9TREE|nr:hypothetical protein BCR39DRAFT_589107 [Naematelia encephala]
MSSFNNGTKVHPDKTNVRKRSADMSNGEMSSLVIDQPPPYSEGPTRSPYQSGDTFLRTSSNSIFHECSEVPESEHPETTGTPAYANSLMSSSEVPQPSSLQVSAIGPPSGLPPTTSMAPTQTSAYGGQPSPVPHSTRPGSSGVSPVFPPTGSPSSQATSMLPTTRLVSNHSSQLRRPASPPPDMLAEIARRRAAMKSSSIGPPLHLPSSCDAYCGPVSTISGDLPQGPVVSFSSPTSSPYLEMPQPLHYGDPNMPIASHATAPRPPQAPRFPLPAQPILPSAFSYISSSDAVPSLSSSSQPSAPFFPQPVHYGAPDPSSQSNANPSYDANAGRVGTTKPGSVVVHTADGAIMRDSAQ